MKSLRVSFGSNALSRALACLLLISSFGAFAAESDLETQPKAEETNSLETLRAYLQLQEQLHATQIAIEENRKEANAAAARNADAFAGRLQAIEQSISTQRTRELEAMQSSNRLMLIAAGAIASLGFAAMLLMAYSHWRAMNRLADIASGLPAGRPLGSQSALAALGGGESAVLALSPPDQPGSRLLGAIDRLEKRILELEHIAQSPLPNATGSTAAAGPATDGETQTAEAGAADEADAHRITVLLGKGQSLLNLDKVEEALACFNEALAINPQHAEGLVKKGLALERMRKADEAIECYDRAIASDRTLTIAYLHKGGLFNRMERFDEALKCYEQALRTQEPNRTHQ
jgi:tetratricopeptide (TPR) repeat protein